MFEIVIYQKPRAKLKELLEKAGMTIADCQLIDDQLKEIRQRARSMNERTAVNAANCPIQKSSDHLSSSAR